MKDVAYMDIADFQRLGFLQELNRQFLHPLGLALEVVIEDDGTTRLGYIWDYRNDPEGMMFNDLSSSEEAEKAAYVLRHFEERAKVRIRRFGWIIQPIGSPERKED